jgi:hypothetical protein
MYAVSLHTSSYADEPTGALYTLSTASPDEQLEFLSNTEKLDSLLRGSLCYRSLLGASSLLRSASHSISLDSLTQTLGSTQLLRTSKAVCLSDATCLRYHLPLAWVLRL